MYQQQTESSCRHWEKSKCNKPNKTISQWNSALKQKVELINRIMGTLDYKVLDT